MPWILEHRPRKMSDMVGNREVLAAVQTMLDKKKPPHAWLFSGQTGVGKTTVARIVADSLGATRSGVVEINAAIVRGIDGVRELEEQASYRMLGSPVSVYILDECHQLTRDAQNGLLKVLEDAPRHAFFILCTTDPEKVIATVRTRCSEFAFQPATPDDIVDLLLRILKTEGKEVDGDVLTEIVEQSRGSPRLAVNMLERCVGIGSVEQAREAIRVVGMNFGAVENFAVAKAICALLFDHRSGRVWERISVLVQRDIFDKKVDLNSVLEGVMNILGRALLTRGGSGIADAVLALDAVRGKAYSRAVFTAVLFRCVEYIGGKASG